MSELSGELSGLGRRASTDHRDRNYLLPHRPEAAQREHRYWATKPPLDQGDTPQCVGYAGYQWLTSYPISNVPKFTPTDLYHQAQLADEWPGENYDGTSVRGLFKALKNDGYVSEYRWASDVAAIVDHLLTVGPVVMGTIWTYGMFMADNEGFIDDVDGEVAGGHAYLLIGASRSKMSSHGVGAVRIFNSWGSNWCDGGRAWLSFKALDWLLHQDGDACAANEIKLTLTVA